ncbi:MAG: Ig-like domain repeat protein [Methanobacterium sp. ERen5]|nr:MAG: Ig-like domain repeat protein [Methanobacterium sp. ERen5]
MKKIVLVCIILMFFLCLNMSSAANPVKLSDSGSQNIYVSPTGNDSSNTGASADSPYATIAKGVSDVNDSRVSTIHLTEGTFTGMGNTAVEINKAHQSQGGSLTIIGAGYNKTFIDGSNVNYMFQINADSIVKFVNITFINGKAKNGGSIANTGNLTILSCIFQNSYATTSGGAIRSTSGNLNISNSVFNNNGAASYGGAVYAPSTVTNIYNSSFTNNYAKNSGAVSASGTISNSYFSNNYATSNYGGSLSFSGSVINNTIINSKINGTSGQGGALYIGGNSYLQNNTMTNCTAVYGNYIYLAGNFNANVIFADATITTPKATVNAIITDDMGHPIYGGGINFYLNSTSIGSGNIINGTATLTYTKLMDNGVYVLNGTSSYFSNLSTIKNGTINMNLNRTPVYFYVSPTGSDNTGDGSYSNPYLTISYAINQGFAKSYDPTIYLLEGTYSGTGNTNMTLTNIGILSIIGETYNKTIIDGQNMNWVLSLGDYTQAKITNLTIQNGNSTVLQSSANLDLTNCTFKNNYGLHTPIIYTEGSVTTVKNLIFRDNQAYGSYFGPCVIGKGTIDNSVFANNSNIGTSTGAMFGGALYTYGLTLTNSIFENNSNLGTGGALNVNGILISINNTFSNNYANYGGAVNANTINSTNDTFYNNTATIGSGGAVSGSGTIKDAKFINNTAGTYGGAIYATNLNISNCSLRNNIAGVNGNDIYIATDGSTGTISGVNLTFVNNSTLNINKISSNVTATLTDDQGDTISGGYVSFYLNNNYIGRADVINGLATLNYIGFKNGSYTLTGNYSNAVDPVYRKDGNLSVLINEVKSVEYYVSQFGSDITGNGSLTNPFATIQNALTNGLESTRTITIHLLEGTYSNIGNTNVTLPGTINFSLIGEGVDKTIIDGLGTNWIFNITAGTGLISLQDLKITNSTPVYTSNPGQYSPVMIAANSTVVVRNMDISNSHGYYGGAISNNGNLSVYKSYCSNNGDSYYGGAIYNTATGNLSVYNSSFVHNTAKGGTAIHNSGKLTVQGSLFKDNFRVAGFTGNGRAIDGLSYDLNISNSIFTNNTECDVYATGNITNSTFFNSTGVIIGNTNAVASYISNCTFTNIKKAITLQTGNFNLNVVGCLFMNDTYAMYGSSVNPSNLTISNSVILSPITILDTATNVTANYNWWGSNSKPSTLISAPTLNMDNWLVMTLAADNKPGFTKKITAGINKYTDGMVNYAFTGYLPVRGYNFTVLDGVISPVSGNLTDNVVNAVFNAGSYGNHSMNATIDNQTMNCTFELYRANTVTNVTVPKSSGRQGSSVVVSVDVKDEKTGDPVNEGYVEFFIENTSIGKVAVRDGKASKEWVIDRDKGSYQINAMYLGSDSFLTSDNFANFDVTSINTTSTVNLSNSTGKYGDLINLTATVKETGTGIVVNAGVVKFFNGNKLIGSSNVVHGLASFNWVSDLAVGKYNITALYSGVGDYLNSVSGAVFEQVFYNGTQWTIYNYMNNTQIQYILDNCKNYSNIIFTAGQYNKLALTVSKPVYIKNNGSVVLVGSGSGTAFTLNSNCSIQGLIFKNYNTGIHNRVNNVTIANNTFMGNVNGVVNYGSGSGVKIGVNNVFSANTGSAIYNYGNNLVLKGYKLVNNKVGITNKGFNVDILSNTISGGQYGVMNYAKSVDINYNKISAATKVGVYNLGSNSNIGHNNLLNNYYGVYNQGVSSKIGYNTISGKFRGIVNNASSVTINGNNIKSVESFGIHNTGTKDNIYKNTVTGLNSGYGIYSSRTSKSTVIQGNIVSKFTYGVFGEGSNDNIKSNSLKTNKYGLNLSHFAKNTQVTYNKIYSNSNYGVYNKGNKTVLSKNSITNNTKYGLATIKSVKNTQNTIKGNKINTTYLK